MVPTPQSVPEVCTHCPHHNDFHSTCAHPMRQLIIKQLGEGNSTDCPMYPEIRAQAMRDLQERMQ